MFCGFVKMMFRIKVVPMSDMSMMCRLFVIAGFMMLGGFVIMLGRVRVMLCRFLMMLGWCSCH
jgi:hypothetical protein